MPSDPLRPRPSSPVCRLDEAPDGYAGYMTRAETIAVLGEVLAALNGEALALLAAGRGSERAAGIRRARDGLVRETLPRIRDDAVHAALRATLAPGVRP